MKATHNSATGEKPSNIWAKLFSCIAKCQTKTIVEQYKTGTTLFDIRVKFNNVGVLCCRHGLAEYNKTLWDVCKEINNLNRQNKNKPVLMVTYEGKITSAEEGEFFQDVYNTFSVFPHIYLGYVSVKKPEWRIIYNSPHQPTYTCNYTKIVGWKVLLPFPKLWQRINNKKIQATRASHPNELLMEDFI
jgi:hypothetical protein